MSPVSGAVFAILATQRCPERIDSLLKVIADPRREALRQEVSAASKLSRQEAAARLSRLNTEASAEVRSALIRRWGPEFNAAPRGLQSWLAARRAAGIDA